MRAELVQRHPILIRTLEDEMPHHARQGKVTIPQPTAPTPVAAAASSSSPFAFKGGAKKAGARKAPGKGPVQQKVSAAELAVAPRPGGPITDLQAALIHHAFTFESQLPHHEQTGTLLSSLATEQEAAEYFEAIRAKLGERLDDGGGPAPAAARKAGAKSPKKAGAKTSKKAGAKSAKKSSKKAAKKAAKRGGAKKR